MIDYASGLMAGNAGYWIWLLVSLLAIAVFASKK